MTVNASHPAVQPNPPNPTGAVPNDTFMARPLPPNMDVQQFSTTPRTIPSGITQYFLPPLETFNQRLREWMEQQPGALNVADVDHQMLYRPTILAQAQVHYARPEQHFNYQHVYSFQVDDLPLSGMVNWATWRAQPIDPTMILAKPYGPALYIQPQDTMIDVERLKSLQAPFFEHVHSAARIEVPALPDLGLIGYPGEAPEQFQARALEHAGQQRDAELEALHRRYSQKLGHIESGHLRVVDSLEGEDDQGFSMFRWMETFYSFFRGNMIESLLEFLETKGRDDDTGAADVVLSAEVAETQAEVDHLYERYHFEADEINQKWANLTAGYTQEVLVPTRDEIIPELFGLAWRPYFYTQINNQPLVLPA